MEVQVSLSRKLAQAVDFANFCTQYGIAPEDLAEIIQLYKDSQKAKGWTRMNELQDYVKRKLSLLGFYRISFINEEMKFYCYDYREQKVYLPFT